MYNEPRYEWEGVFHYIFEISSLLLYIFIGFDVLFTADINLSLQS
jgi:hypothetical protein